MSAQNFCLTNGHASTQSREGETDEVVWRVFLFSQMKYEGC